MRDLIMTRHRKVAHREQWEVDKDWLMTEEGSAKRGGSFKKYYRKATCAVCGETVSSRQKLQQHMQRFHGAGLPDYGKCFDRKWNKKAPEGYSVPTQV